jgi:hypothetical protein
VPIIDKSSETNSVTRVPTALSLFTDRHQVIRRFLEYVHAESPIERILFLHGDGGNGKSLLLKFLSTYCCKTLDRDNWDFVRSREDQEFILHAKDAQNAINIPNVTLDFSLGLESEIPTDPLSGLLRLRRKLSTFGFRFPSYDFACVWHYLKARKMMLDDIKQKFPADELDFIGDLIDLFSKHPLGSPLTSLLKVLREISRRTTFTFSAETAVERRGFETD